MATSDGDATNDKSRTVDSVALCTDCHNATNSITSTPRGKTLTKINWSASCDLHGAASQDMCNYGDKKAPYTEGVNYVLSCLDCHEPHGSPNEYLLREEVNGTHVGVFQPGYWYNFCNACHKDLDRHNLFWSIGPSTGGCNFCHSHASCFGGVCNCCGTCSVNVYCVCPISCERTF